MTGPAEQILVAQHLRWLPVPIDGAASWLPDDVVSVFGEESRPVAEAVVAAAGSLADAPDDTVNLGVWLLLGDADTFEPHGFATLRATALGPDPAVGPDDLAALVAGDTPTYSAPLVNAVSTAAGPATHLRLRPLVDVDGESQVHQVDVVAWARPEQQALFLLSHYGTDLIEACRAGDLLIELAEGVSGL